MEFECPATPGAGSGNSSNSSNSGSDSGEGETPIAEKEEAGYWRQEVEGLGGVVKKKFRKREKVGAIVRECEDESKGGELLGREKKGDWRAWCGWCGRVVLAKRES